MFQDKTLACRDCGAEFTFTVREQEFYAEKGFQNEPSRCPQCRAARKAAGGGGGGGGGGYRSDYGAPRQMTKVICADCGQETEVPFTPRDDRPVYCRDCFAKRRASRGY